MGSPGSPLPHRVVPFHPGFAGSSPSWDQVLHDLGLPDSRGPPVVRCAGVALRDRCSSDRRAGGRGSRGGHDCAVSERVRTREGEEDLDRPRRPRRCDPVGHLRALGLLRAAAQRGRSSQLDVCPSRVHPDLQGDLAAGECVAFHRRPRSRPDDRSDYRFGEQGGLLTRSTRRARSRPGARSDALADDPLGGAPVRKGRSDRSSDARDGPCTRGDDRCVDHPRRFDRDLRAHPSARWYDRSRA